MPSPAIANTPGLASFLKSLKANPVESSIEHFISLLKRRQIRNSRPCAIATAQLLRRVVQEFKGKDATKLIRRIKEVGHRLTSAQPREMSVGNIVRRVLGLVREVLEEGESGAAMSDAGVSTPGQQTPHDSLQRPGLNSTISTFSPLKHGSAQPADLTLHLETASDSTDMSHRPPLLSSHTSYGGSLFGLFSQPETANASPSATPAGARTPSGKAPLTAGNLAGLGDSTTKKEDLKAETLEGINELLDELEQVDEQIAEYALQHIHSDEIILTHTSSMTIQKFLLTAAKKRKFTVIHVEAYPNDSDNTHATVLTGRKRNEEDEDSDERFKPLTAAGITVILIPESAVFAIMSRVNKVILATHAVLANGGLVAAVGARTIAKAAKMHQTPVVVVSGVYKLSPVYPFDVEELIEYGDAGAVVPYDDGDFVEKVDVVNPLFDYVPADLVDLYITNLGGHAPSYLYRIVADHYRAEDVNL
ncbi:putative translation initiation factor eIF-2B subunit beta [Lasiodiplodia hormozganensis]|uniref:Translation initiation factor eIF2B subunit beta n=1 Tax=Lasiodiplodia hormozganensis TaxID=869390 RepID=A0AA40CQV5_9PEZI|nr:putative translation initiation factor eIF-2B subunit beta [Lasiodiplodia hormozganensis]